MEHLTKNGISVSVHYFPNHLYDIYKPYYRSLPVCESVWKGIVTLPLFPSLKQEEIQLVINTVKNFRTKT